MRDFRTRFLIVVGLFGGIWLVCLIFGGEGWAPDEQARRLFAAGSNEGLRQFALKIKVIGEWPVLIPAILLTALYLGFRRRLRAALLLVTGFLGWLFVLLQQIIVDRAKPDLPKHLEAVHSMSFPSNHAANAMIVFLAIALFIPRRRRRHIALALVAALLAGVAGWTDLALDQTWTSDVVGGWAFGILWVTICLRLVTDRRLD